MDRKLQKFKIYKNINSLIFGMFMLVGFGSHFYYQSVRQLVQELENVNTPL